MRPVGAGWWPRFHRITLPLLAPGLATTFCLTFVLAFSVFTSAVLVGDPAGSTRVISIAAYHAAYEVYDYALASAIAVVMVVLSLAVGLGAAAWQAKRAEAERDEARRDWAREEAVRYQLTRLFRTAITDQGKEPATAKAMIDASAQRVPIACVLTLGSRPARASAGRR